MAKPLTRDERALARGYAETVYADTNDSQKHAAAVMILRLLDTVAALEAEVARLRPLAEVGEAVEAMPVGFGLSHAAAGLWLIWDNRGGDDLDETCGETALVALQKLAARRAANRGGNTDA